MAAITIATLRARATELGNFIVGILRKKQCMV
jgi:hypothetical protein